MKQSEIADRFYPHRLSDEAEARLTELRHGFLGLASILGDNAPDSREKSVAMRKLEEASFWVAAAVARNQGT